MHVLYSTVQPEGVGSVVLVFVSATKVLRLLTWIGTCIEILRTAAQTIYHRSSPRFRMVAPRPEIVRLCSELGANARFSHRGARPLQGVFERPIFGSRLPVLACRPDQPSSDPNAVGLRRALDQWPTSSGQRSLIRQADQRDQPSSQ